MAEAMLATASTKKVTTCCVSLILFPDPFPAATSSDPRPAPRSSAVPAPRWEYCPDPPPRRWPGSHQTSESPGVSAAQPLEVAAQTTRRSYREWPALPAQAVARCERPYLLESTRPVYIDAPA